MPPVSRCVADAFSSVSLSHAYPYAHARAMLRSLALYRFILSLLVPHLVPSPLFPVLLRLLLRLPRGLCFPSFLFHVVRLAPSGRGSLVQAMLSSSLLLPRSSNLPIVCFRRIRPRAVMDYRSARTGIAYSLPLANRNRNREAFCEKLRVDRPTGESESYLSIPRSSRTFISTYC